jgi:geranylgeranyl pyrophosphate synthase
MVSLKTGGLFSLLMRLMAVDQKDPAFEQPLNELCKLLGQHFQIRDDYQNLHSATYAAQKGFCEDLDEDKLSFPLIHCLHQQESPVELREILQARKETGALSKEIKLHVLDQLEEAGSFGYTIQTLKRLQERIQILVVEIEVSTDCTNWVLRLFLQKLDVQEQEQAHVPSVPASTPVIMEGWMVREYLQTLGEQES